MRHVGWALVIAASFVMVAVAFAAEEVRAWRHRREVVRRAKRIRAIREHREMWRRAGDYWRGSQ